MDNISIKASVEVTQQTSWTDTRCISKQAAECGGSLSHELIESELRSITEALREGCLQQLRRDEVLLKTADTPEPEPAATP